MEQNNFNFNDWILKNGNFKTVYLTKSLKKLKSKLPNIDQFLYWVFYKQYEDFSDISNKYDDVDVDTFEVLRDFYEAELLKYTPFEQAFFVKIIIEENRQKEHSDLDDVFFKLEMYLQLKFEDVTFNLPHEVKRKISVLIKELYEKATLQENTIQTEYNFSVLQWAAVFYYADTDANITGKSIREKQRTFIAEHKIKFSVKSLDNKYYDAKKRINETQNFPITKLEEVTPFLEKHYPAAIDQIKEDIRMLKFEKDDKNERY